MLVYASSAKRMAPTRPRYTNNLTGTNSRAGQAQATARRCRVMRTGFFFAQGRCAGRPRRGNAAI